MKTNDIMIKNAKKVIESGGYCNCIRCSSYTCPAFKMKKGVIICFDVFDQGHKKHWFEEWLKENEMARL